MGGQQHAIALCAGADGHLLRLAAATQDHSDKCFFSLQLTLSCQIAQEGAVEDRKTTTVGSETAGDGRGILVEAVESDRNSNSDRQACHLQSHQKHSVLNTPLDEGAGHLPKIVTNSSKLQPRAPSLDSCDFSRIILDSIACT